MADILDYKCPYCGGKMEFDTALQKMKCPYCDSTVEMSEMQSKDAGLDAPAPSVAGFGEAGPTEDNIQWDVNSGASWTNEDGMAVFTCKSCGGEIISDENTVATACPFCGNPVVLSGRVSGGLKPEFVIPFKLDKKAAKDKLRAYVKGKKFAPKEFESENKLDEIKGVYVPYWLFDSDVEASVTFGATKTRLWSDRDYNYTETSYFDVFRAGTMRFENIPVDGSKKMPDDLMESIEPFDFKEAVSFQTAYLSGFLADKYDVSREESYPRANERLKTSAGAALRDTVHGYDTVEQRSTFINTLGGLSKYALYPVWLLNTTYKGEKYTFAMNGQTGKFIGNLPISKGKLGALFGGLSVGIAAVVFVLGVVSGLF